MRDVRCFVGIDLDDDLRLALHEVSEHLVRADPRWAAEKWVPSENLHFTLSFLGEIPAVKLDTLVAHLRCTLSIWEPFEADCTSAAEAIPTPRRARLLWARYDDPKGRFSALAGEVQETAGLLGIGHAVPDMRFTPHVTLVRARRPRPFSQDALALPAPVSPVSVQEVTVFTSVLTRSGPVYERLPPIVLGSV